MKVLVAAFSILAVGVMTCAGRPADGPVGGGPGFVGPSGPVGGPIGSLACGSSSALGAVYFPGDVAQVELQAETGMLPTDGANPSVVVRVVGPDGAEVALRAPPLARRNGWNLSSTVQFTVAMPGTYTVTATFEPSQATSTARVAVSPFFSERGAFIPTTDCTEAPWPLSADTIACETTSGIAVLSVDGGRVSLDGKNLAAAGEVLWSLHDAGTSFMLQRHEWTGSVLRRTHEWGPDFSDRRVRGLHTRELATRLRVPLAQHQFLKVARVDDDAGARELLIQDPGLVFTRETAFAAGSLLAVDGLVWRVGEHSPCPEPRAKLFSFPQLFAWSDVALPTAEPDREFARWPLWLERRSRSLLVQDAEGGVFVDLPLNRVLRVAERHVVLTADGGFLITPIQ